MSGLAYTVWELTLRCDLACGHCGSRAGKARPDELSTAEALDVTRQLADLGCREVTLIGGEAYLRDDWDEIARAVTRAGMTCSMVSGGRGLTRERARRAAAAGVSSVSISLDGLEETHDRQRGVAGSFAAGLRALANLREAGLKVACNTQINRLTLPELDDLFALLVGEGILGWQLQLTVPMGRAAERPEWLLQPYDLLEVIPKLAELKGQADAAGILLWPGNNVGYFGPHEALLRRELPRGHSVGCTAGIHTLGLEADGTIKGCPSLPTTPYAGGNVRDVSLREAWETSQAVRFMRDRAEEPWGFCGDCYYAELCRGGCSWTAHVFFGRAGNNPYCHHRALEHERQGLREVLNRVEAPPGEPFDHGRFELRSERVARPLPVLQAGRQLSGRLDLL